MSRSALFLLAAAGLVAGLTSCVSRDSYLKATGALANTEKALGELKARQGELEGINATLRGQVEDLSSRAVNPDQMARLRKLLEERRKGGKLQGDAWSLQDGKLTYTIKGSVLFGSGRSDLTAAGKQVLSQVGEVMKSAATRLEIRGHTDSDPIRKSKWKSNMDLGLARAYAVWDELGRRGFPREKMMVSSCGPYRPKVEDSTEEGKRQNRRVEILLLETK